MKGLFNSIFKNMKLMVNAHFINKKCVIIHLVVLQSTKLFLDSFSKKSKFLDMFKNVGKINL